MAKCSAKGKAKVLTTAVFLLLVTGVALRLQAAGQGLNFTYALNVGRYCLEYYYSICYVVLILYSSVLCCDSFSLFVYWLGRDCSIYTFQLTPVSTGVLK